MTIGFPKGKTKRQLKGQQDRAEAKVIKAVRAKVMERELHDCRLYVAVPELIPFGWCHGRLAWAHLGDQRRFKTVGLPPEERHTTAGSLALCERHHTIYDRHAMEIDAGPKGADGPLRFILHLSGGGTAVYQEPER
jgi:hypothetical protein